MHLIFEGNKK